MPNYSPISLDFAGRCPSVSINICEENDMRDIGPGCEGVDVALDTWINALAVGNAEILHEILTDDFLLSCDPTIAGGRMNKAATRMTTITPA